MGYASDKLEEIVRTGEVVALVAEAAPAEGANESPWPGLTFYRFERRVPLHWDTVGSLSLCVVAQGRKRVRIDGVDHHYDPFHYLVMSRRMRFQAEILEGSPTKPFLSLVLQMPPQLVTDVLHQMQQRSASLFRSRPRRPGRTVYVSPFDQTMTGVLHRFLQSLGSETDRAVLAPMYLREVVYRLLHADQCHRLVEEAAQGPDANPITAAIAFMRDHLHEPITITDVADEVCMSTSAFAHLFRETVGVSPYQFLKDHRLDAARAALVNEGCSVSEVAARVGYSSLSHFISQFKRRFGETPGAYAERLHEMSTLSLAEST